MKRYCVKVQSTATTSLVVEAQTRAEAEKEAEALARLMKNRVLWGVDGVQVVDVKQQDVDPKDEFYNDLRRSDLRLKR